MPRCSQKVLIRAIGAAAALSINPLIAFADNTTPSVANAPKAAVIDPVVAPVKREQPSIAGVRAAAKITTPMPEAVVPAVKTSKQGSKVAGWKAKAGEASAPPSSTAKPNTPVGEQKMKSEKTN